MAPILSYFRTPPRLIFEIGRREGSPKVSSTSLKIGHVQVRMLSVGMYVRHREAASDVHGDQAFAPVKRRRCGSRKRTASSESMPEEIEDHLQHCPSERSPRSRGPSGSRCSSTSARQVKASRRVGHGERALSVMHPGSVLSLSRHWCGSSVGVERRLRDELDEGAGSRGGEGDGEVDGEMVTVVLPLLG